MTTIKLGDKVRVHRNLQAQARGLPGHWTVTVGNKTVNVDTITLRAAVPAYWRGRDGSDGRAPTGQNLTIGGGKRTVHAWFDGIVCEAPRSAGVEVTYNPKTRAGLPFFHTPNGREVTACGVLHFATDGRAYGDDVR